MATSGLKVTVILAVCPGFKVTGGMIPIAPNREPTTETDEIVTGAVPDEVRVTDLVAWVPTFTLPNETVVALRDSAGVAAFSCSARLCDELFALAVTVAVCAVLTEATLAEKDALDEPAGTVAPAGSVTAVLLLARLTLVPPVGAGPDKITAHGSTSDPVIDVLLQDIADTVGNGAVPVPLRLTVARGALLEIANCPATEPALVGLN